MNEQENQFRIGGVYRDANDRVQRLLGAGYGGSAIPEGTAWANLYQRGMWVGDGYRRLSDGKDTADYTLHDLAFPRDLIPGELTQTASGWVALGAEKQEEAAPEYSSEYTPEKIARILWGKRPAAPTSVDPNAAMILRDGPAKLVAAVYDVLIDVPASAKPAICGLTRLAAQSHRLGSAWVG